MIAQNQKEFLINRIVDKLTEFLVIDSSIDLTDALKVVYITPRYINNSRIRKVTCLYRVRHISMNY